jgi:site-specific recombinase XerD
VSDDDDSQPGAGAGRGVAAEHAGSDPLAGRAPADAASTSLVTSPTRAIRRRARFPSLSPEAAAYAAEAYAPATVAAYQADCAHFEQWCAAEGRIALPADLDTITRYIVAHGEKLGRATLARRLVGIGFAHRVAGSAWVGTHPLVKATLRGVLRRHGKPARQAAALMTDEVRMLVATCDESLVGLRDRALLLVGYAGGLRRSELVAITREDIEAEPGGLRIRIQRSKTDPTGEGAFIGLALGEHRATCPVRSLHAWMEASEADVGAIFRKISGSGRIAFAGLTPGAVRRILLHRAALAGLAVAMSERLSPHGLRAGFITQAHLNGASEEAIMAQARHRDWRTTRRYIRQAKVVTETPAKRLGL